MIMEMETLKTELRATLPPLVSRKALSELGRWTVGTLANRDSKGKGPEKLVMAGRVVYPREALIEWLVQQIGQAQTMTKALDGKPKATKAKLMSARPQVQNTTNDGPDLADMKRTPKQRTAEDRRQYED